MRNKRYFIHTESNSTTITPRFPDPSAKKPSMQRKQQLVQQESSPRNTNQQEMTSSQKGIPTTNYSEENVSFQVTTKKESPYFEITNQSNFDDVTSLESSLPSQVMNIDDDLDKRGNAYKMPSKIKEKKLVAGGIPATMKINNAPSFRNSNTCLLYTSPSPRDRG